MGFFFIFFGIYAAMNAYLFGKVWIAFPRLGWFRLVIAAVLLLMVLGPVLAQYLERWRHFRLADGFGYVVYTWLAMIFWFTLLMLAADAWNLCARGVGLAFPAAKAAALSPRAALGLVWTIIILATAYGLWEAQDIRLHNVTLHVSSLPGGRSELRVVQLADLHLGMHVGDRRLDKIVALVEQARPDIIVSTGDIIDGPPEHMELFLGRLRDMRTPLGKFATLGNHEFYWGAEASTEFLRQAGFDVLRQKSVAIGNELLLAGVDDSGRHFDGRGLSDENAVLPPREHRPVTLLLKHQPAIRADSLGRFDLQISGHTHGGQIFPFGLITGIVYPYYKGWHEVGEGSKLSICNGAGTWGPPIRLLAPPEVTVITLTTK